MTLPDRALKYTQTRFSGGTKEGTDGTLTQHPYVCLAHAPRNICLPTLPILVLPRPGESNEANDLALDRHAKLVYGEELEDA